MYRSTKTYCHNVGLSCAFRQWRAESHCHFVHGYAMEIRFEFEASELDHRNWVVDFGALGGLKEKLKDYFDHKVIISDEDPHLNYFLEGHKRKVMDVVILDGAVGCEAFAELAYNLATQQLEELGLNERVTVVSAEVREHGANSGIYLG